MKNYIAEIISGVIKDAFGMVIGKELIEVTPKFQHGDYASNVAFLIGKKLKIDSFKVAKVIGNKIFKNEIIYNTEVVAPGFINFRINIKAFAAMVKEIVLDGDNYGLCEPNSKGISVNIEFVSANPTGPLHVGHGRSAVLGASLSSLLRSRGYNVCNEYYVNDAGRQMVILALSTWIRYLQIATESNLIMPSKAYVGEYISDIAEAMYIDKGNDFVLDPGVLNSNVGQESDYDDGEDFLNSCIFCMQDFLSKEDFEFIQEYASGRILQGIKDDLTSLGVEFDSWFSEKSLIDEGWVNKGIKSLSEKGYVYTKDGALWFRAKDFGDSKDRVLVRSNGATTYFASDVAYHLYKYMREYDIIIDLFGSDHHGYVGRIKSFLEALGEDTGKMSVLLIQFAVLFRGKEKVQMSTRSGEFVTLKQLTEEVGRDAVRFFYIMHKSDKHMEFDLELAKSRSNKNPVYYIQYAYARICSLGKKIDNPYGGLKEGWDNFELLKLDSEKNMIIFMCEFRGILDKAAINYEPHLLANYLQTLAGMFHSYYNSTSILDSDLAVRNVRLCMITALGQILKNGMSILGLSTPSKM